MYLFCYHVVFNFSDIVYQIELLVRYLSGSYQTKDRPL